MSVYESAQQLFEWCSIPAEQLVGHPKAKVPIRILATPADVHRDIAETMLEELKSNNAAGQPTRWILPCGPRAQYAIFIERVNRERISLANVHVFHMDDHLDWQGRHLPLEHPYSYEGWMRRNLYGKIDAELTIPPAQRHFPSINAIDAIAEAIDKVGGVDSVFGGIGYRGHIAFNEPPRSPWYKISKEEYRNATTRILHLNEDTLIALSHRGAGGVSEVVPPMVITVGMREILSSARICLYSETGAWKQAVIRMLLFGNVSPDVPATYVQEHPNASVTVDAATAACPPLGL